MLIYVKYFYIYLVKINILLFVYDLYIGVNVPRGTLFFCII